MGINGSLFDPIGKVTEQSIHSSLAPCGTLHNEATEWFTGSKIQRNFDCSG